MSLESSCLETHTHNRLTALHSHWWSEKSR